MEGVEPGTPDLFPPSHLTKPSWAWESALRVEGLDGLTRGTETAGDFSQAGGVCLHQFQLVSLLRKYSEWGFQAILLHPPRQLCKATQGLLPRAAGISHTNRSEPGPGGKRKEIHEHVHLTVQ